MIGGLTIIYLLRRRNRIVAVGFGGSIVLGAIVILLQALALIPLTSSWLLLGLVLLVMTGFFYAAIGKGPRMIPFIALFFLGVFILPLVQFYFFYFPTALIFVYASTCLAVADSYRKSEVEVASRLGKISRRSRVLVLPFSTIERIVRTSYDGRHLRSALFGSYIAFELTLLLVVPFLFATLLGGNIAFEIVNIIFVGVLVSAGLKFGKAP